jgi:hypothetical protein
LPFSVCPGSKQLDLNSFLGPFLDELQLLQEGVPAYDAHGDTFFLLKAHLVLCTGDTPAISKLFHLSGHVAKHPCRACIPEGTQYTTTKKKRQGENTGENTEEQRHTMHYYPFHPPTQPPNPNAPARLNPENLPPRRTEQDYFIHGQESLTDPESAKGSGIKGVSPLISRLNTMTFPESLPFDIMHLVFLGFARDLCRLLSGTYFKERQAHLNVEGIGEIRMSTGEWRLLGVDMAKIGAPMSWGRYPRDISKYIKGFKSEELQNFLTHYLLPLVFNRVNESTYQALQRFVLAISLATSMELDSTEVEIIDKQLTVFIEWFYNTYYQRNYERLPVCKYIAHCLLHLKHDIRKWGPPSYYWQYTQVIPSIL